MFSSLSRLKFLLADLRPQGLPPCSYLLICHDADRGYTYNGLPYSQLLDTIRENLEAYGLNVSVIAQPFSVLCGSRASANPISINGCFARASLAAKIVSLFFRPENSYADEFHFRFWRRLLIQMNPNVVIGIQPSAALCAAGKSLGIPVADHQHGVIECRLDSNWYYSIRKQSAFGRNGIPDRVICWDHSSARVIEALWPWVETIVAGNPWVNRFLASDPHDQLVTHEMVRIQQKLDKFQKSKPVLLTTQWHPAFDGIQIPDNISKAIAITTMEGLQWCIKFHPMEMQNIGMAGLVRYAIDALGQDVWDAMIDLSSYSLPSILPHLSYHVTGFSSSTIEAAVFGVRTGLWDHRQEVETWFQHEIADGHATFLPNNEIEIARKILMEVSKSNPLVEP